MTEIPQPPGWPIIGNLLELSEHNFTARMATKYDSIFKVSYGAGKPCKIHVCSVELLNEICDERRFAKNPIDGGLFEVRNLTGDGLFTAFHGEENWGLAHRILMPVFGPLAIGNMFEGVGNTWSGQWIDNTDTKVDMHEIACQLLLKWARAGQNARIAVTEDFTRLTLDTLALCTMDTRFNSFYSETPHSFVTAMNSFLKESGSRSFRPSFLNNYVYKKSTMKYIEDIKLMREIANQVLKRRHADPSRKNNLVDAMIHDKDPKTGKILTEISIINNMITFLIAGHETTSGLLSFVLYLLVQNPDAMRKAREEVLSVLGKGVMIPTMTSRLPYVSAVIRETLRLHPTAPGFTVQPKSSNPEDFPLFIGKERYVIRRGETIHAMLPRIHRDPAVFGDDAEDFRPERMLDENFNKLPKNAWKPFGNGARGCIGRAFALQEAIIVIALLLQNFDFEMYDPNYELAIRKTLTVKPKDFSIRTTLRKGLTPATLQQRLFGGQTDGRKCGPGVISSAEKPKRLSEEGLIGLLICYGSNTGTCQALAHSLAREAYSYGFRSTVVSMDQAIHQINVETPVVIITASYEGDPPNNAIRFVRWLERLIESPFAGCRHAVFGCGNRDWANTFQRVPALVDEAFIRCGSVPLVKRGSSDAADNNILNDFDQWVDEFLWPALGKQYIIKSQDSEPVVRSFEILQSSRITELLPDGDQAIVQEAKILTTPAEPQKRHVKIRLPKGMTYTAGDYLAILPVNHDDTVKEVMTRFGIAIDSKILTSDGSEKSVYAFLREYVELNQIATEKNIRAILQSIPEKSQQDALEKISVSRAITLQQISLLAILQQFPTAAISFPEYLAMLPPLHPRQYSISSSPLSVGADTCTLTYSVVKHTATTNTQSDSLALRDVSVGAASTYLASLLPNDRLWVSVRPGPAAFHLPPDDHVPIVMICAGSGLAPFLGFVQERVRRIEESTNSPCPRSLGPMSLFIGCRHPERDALYAAELRGWAENGAIDLKYAFSAAPELSKGCKYVQEQLWREQASWKSVLSGEGMMFVCGDKRVADGVGRVVVRAYAEEYGVEEEKARAWLGKIRNERFVCDVFD